MKRYYILDKEKAYWSHSKKFGYWSIFEDKYSIKNRSSFPYLIARIMQGLMKNEGIETTLLLKK